MEKDKTDANDLVSPKNTERLYGKKLQVDETPAGDPEATPTSLPEDFEGVDQEIDQNMFPSKAEEKDS